MMVIKYMEQTGFWKNYDFMGTYFQNMMLSVDMVKTMPVFHRLGMEDQVKHTTGLTNYHLYMANAIFFGF